VTRNQLISRLDVPRDIESETPTPARRKKAGAQKWVIHLVKKRNGVAFDRSSG
jgi:hypothetical protein